MSDADKPMEEPKLGKSRRRGAVIDLKAVEARTLSEPVAETSNATSADAAAVPTAPTEAKEAAPTETAAPHPTEEPAAAKSEPEAHAGDPAGAETASRVEPLQVPPAPHPVKPSMALPLVVAAGLGLVFGGLGGVFAPAYVGGDNAESARIAIIDRIQQQLVKDQSSLASIAELDKVRQAVAKLEAEIAQRTAPVAGPAPAPAVPAGLEQRVAGIEAGLKALAERPVAAVVASPVPTVDLKPLQDQIGTIQGQMRDLAVAMEQGRSLQAQVAALDGVMKDLAGRVDGASRAAEAAPRAAAQAASTALDPRLAAIGQRIEQAEKRLEAGRAAPLFAAVQALAQSFHRGAPFAAELTAVEALGAPAEQLQPLRAFAERGAPTPQRLQEAFSAQAGRLAGDGSQPGVMGYVNRFVTVRPTEESGSNTPAAIVGSIEAALRRADVATAAAHWSRLPETARSASADWGALVASRVAAAKALGDLQTATAAALRK